MKFFREINVGIFFGLINDRRVLVKISDTMAKDVINNDYISIDKYVRIIILF